MPCAPAVGSAQHPSTSPSGGSIDLFARGDDDGPPATEVVESPAAAYDSAAKPAAATDDTAAATDATAEPAIAAGDVTGGATAALTARTRQQYLTSRSGIIAEALSAGSVARKITPNTTTHAKRVAAAWIISSYESASVRRDTTIW